MTAFEPTTDCLVELQEQIDRIVHHELFRGSDALRRILAYLGEHAIQTPGKAVREYRIATEVLGRLEDFDARADSCVRVQVGRLRSRLRRYYAGPGEHDPLVVTIPVGCYMLVAKPAIRKTPMPRPVAVTPAAAPEAVTVAAPAQSRWSAYGAVAIVCLLLGIVLGVAGARYLSPSPPAPSWIVGSR